MFGKQNIYYGAFCRILFVNLISIKEITYDQYFPEDKECVLSNNEFESLNYELPDFYILLGMAGLLQKHGEGKIKMSSRDLSYDAMTALKLAFEDSGFKEEYIIKKMEYLVGYFQDFMEYCETVEVSKSKDMFFHAAMFFSTSFTSNTNNVAKAATYTAIIKTSKLYVTDYFNSIFAKVKLAY